MPKYQGKEITTTLQANTKEELDRLVRSTQVYAGSHGMEDFNVLERGRDRDGGYRAIIVAHNWNPLEWIKGKFGRKKGLSDEEFEEAFQRQVEEQEEAREKAEKAAAEEKVEGATEEFYAKEPSFEERSQFEGRKVRAEEATEEAAKTSRELEREKERIETKARFEAAKAESAKQEEVTTFAINEVVRQTGISRQRAERIVRESGGDVGVAVEAIQEEIERREGVFARTERGTQRDIDELAALGIDYDKVGAKTTYIGPKDKMGRPASDQDAANPANWIQIKATPQALLAQAYKEKTTAVAARRALTAEKYKPLTSALGAAGGFAARSVREIGGGIARGSQRGLAPGRGGPQRATRMLTATAPKGLYDISGLRDPKVRLGGMRQTGLTIDASMLTGAGLGALKQTTIPTRMGGAIQTSTVERQTPGLSKISSQVLQSWNDGFRTPEEIKSTTGLALPQINKAIKQLNGRGLLQGTLGRAGRVNPLGMPPGFRRA